MYVSMTLCDVVGRLFQGFRKKGAVRLGLFLLWPPDYRVISVYNDVTFGYKSVNILVS